MSATTPTNNNSVWIYFLLVMLLGIPFWLIGFLPDEQWRRLIPINLPLSAFMFVCPVMVALILTYKEAGGNGVKVLLKRTFDYKMAKNKLWYIPAVFLFPAIMLISYIAMYLMGMPLPADIQIPFTIIPVFFVLFFLEAICEELGWSGYAIDRLQDKCGALGGALIVGTVWAVWHFIPYIQTGHAMTWVWWHFGATIIGRVLYVWIYNNAGRSVFAAIVYHAMTNVGYFTFPNYGSHYDPFITFIVMLVIVMAIIFLWGPRTLDRYRYAIE